MDSILLLLITLAGLSSIIMAYKAIKKKDVSIWGAVLARIYLAFAVGGFMAINSTEKLQEMRIAIAVVLASDIIINILYFILRKHVREIEQNKTIISLNNLTDKYLTLVENAPIGIYSFDEFGTIEYVNCTLLNMFGYTKEELIGKCVYDFVHEKDLSAVKYYIHERLSNRIKTVTYSIRLLKKDTTYVLVELRGSKTENGHPTITGTVVLK